MIEKIKWYFNRLMTMNSKEVLWRLNLEVLMLYEYFRFHNRRRVDEISYSYAKESFDINVLGLVVNRSKLNSSNWQEIYAGFLLSDYSYKWHCGFNSENTWPLIFSYKLKYKGVDSIGDARINWQLNRHNEFVINAKNYYLTRDTQYYNKLNDLYNDWNDKNPFLYGISWTSTMEIAIRCINWVFTFFFVYNACNDSKILDRLKVGIINMSDYVYLHRSRYSSANNHLIVEMYCVLLVSFLCEDDNRINKIYNILESELVIQNYEDGVNKEQSLHYQAFFLEAFALSAMLFKKKRKDISKFKPLVSKMCLFIHECINDSGEVIEFGDNDEGYILSVGDESNYYKYVLNLCSETFDIAFNSKYKSETLELLFNRSEYEGVQQTNKATIFPEGGYAIVRDTINEIHFGIDFGELGFGRIAAHGHSDALSFQILIKGYKFLIDPGTYVYHINRKKRDYYRNTINHNTVCIDGNNQSEIKGSFLWGKRACCKLLRSVNDGKCFDVELSHDGYGFDVRRKYCYDWKKKLSIIDDIGNHCGVANYTFAREWEIEINDKLVTAEAYGVRCIICFDSDELVINKVSKFQSLKYGVEEKTTAIEVEFMRRLETTIHMGV